MTALSYRVRSNASLNLTANANSLSATPVSHLLVEALSLVVRPLSLELSWPGGSDGFISAMKEDDDVRYVLASRDHVVCSALEPEVIFRHTDRLVDAGLIGEDEGEAIDFVIVDQLLGLPLPCTWLAFGHDERGVAYVGPPASPLSELTVPSGWTLQEYRELVRTDMREEPGRMLRLHLDASSETWVDFRTGRLIRSRHDI